MTGGPIAGYGLISDCNSAALVDRAGSIDWLCLPRYDSRAFFARLLDPRAGHWRICPAGSFETDRRYVPGTLALETTFRTETGEVRLIDVMPFAEGETGHDPGLNVPHEVLRLVEGIAGEVEMELELSPRPEYGLSSPIFCEDDKGVYTFGGPDRLGIDGDAPLSIEGPDLRARFSVTANKRVGFSLRWGAPTEGRPLPCPAGRVAERISQTVERWKEWERDHDIYQGPHRENVRFSARVLKGLTYRPTGAIVAAPTTSLPETVGGERNWDYRYAWIRDASLALDALWIGACTDEAENFLSWMAGAAGGHVHEDVRLQIMYGITGERDLAERELAHLSGWRHSRPVRVGNGAWTQTQLDVYGEFLAAFCLYLERIGDIDPVVSHFLVDLADAAARHWGEPDAGMWEMRAEPRQHVSSKLLCWAALDRAVRLGPRIGAADEIPRWEQERDKIREAILEHGWSDSKKSFAQSFGSDDLDASVLLMPIFDFLPATDDRMRSTIEAVDRELTDDGLVLRYRSEDGLTGAEGTFVICSFWMVSCLARLGDVERAQELFKRVVGYSNDLGLLAEEFDVATGELLGNFPQAFSHIGLITAAWDLDQALTQSR